MHDVRQTREQVTLGVDTHAELHVAAALDERGRLLGTCTIPTTTSGKVRRQETKRMLFANGLPTLQPGSHAMQGCTA